MKKAIMFIASFAVLILTLSAFTNRPVAPSIGFKAPEIHLGHNMDDKIKFKGTDTEYVLLSFWSSSDAASRLRCNYYTTLTGHNNRLGLVAINFDRNCLLFEEIVKRDNLSLGSQYHIEGKKAATIKKNYHLDRGLHTFMIDSQGIIIAIDPDETQITTLLN